MNIQKEIRKRIYLLISAAFGITAFLLIFGLEPLRYTGTGWLLHGFDGNDITQHQTGWEFYRRSPWTFPLCNALNLGYPEGTSISFTDSIPIVALFFKILDPILPETFQYFGLYMCFSFVMQAIFSAALLHHFTKNKIYSSIGSIIFLTASCFLERSFRHTALSSHWLLLAGMLIYFKRRRYPKRYKYHLIWSLMLCISLGVHPYLFGMLFGLFIISEIETFLKIKKLELLLKFVGCVVSILCFGYALGLFGTNISPAQGFGIYSLNLNALNNPFSKYHEKWSSAVEARPIYAGQGDGTYYLGLFMNVMFIITLLVFLLYGSKFLREWINRHKFFLTLILLYSIFAISNIVTYNDKVIFRYNIPLFILDKINIFRASARFFFIPYYCIIIFTLVFLFRMLSSRFLSIVFVIVIAAFQIIEIKPGLEDLHKVFENRQESLFLSNDWNEIAAEYDTALSIDNLADRTLAFWLSENGFKTDMMITAPVHMDAYWKRTKADRELLKEELREGSLTLVAKTIYIISENTGKNCTFQNEQELNEFIEEVTNKYKGRACMQYMTDWVKNYWILVPNKIE